MNLTVLMPHIPTQRFECRSCTNCCRELVVHLTPLDREKIDRQNWAGRITGPAFVRLGRAYVLNHAPGGGCVFLREDGLCRIHAEFGGSEKPLACQLYPFTLDAEEAGVRVGVRFDCPTVARNEGTSLNVHRQEVTRLARELIEQVPEHFRQSAPMFATGRPMSGQVADVLTRFLDRWLADASRPLFARLMGISSFADTLSMAQLGALPDAQLIELVEMIAADLPNAVAESGRLPPPTQRQKRLLRQSVFAHCEHISLKQARAGVLESMRYRIGQLLRARKLASATGILPPLQTAATDPATIPAESIEQISPSSDRASDEMITRYLRARVAAHSYYGPSYYLWPALDGLAALLLATATIGWLARYFAASARRATLEIDDLLRAIGVVDRAAGRARELGAKSAKLRLSYLRGDAGLLRLIGAYPIMAH